MKKSFFEKSYIITLVLFLVLLNGGIFSLAIYTYNSNDEAAKQICRTELFCIVEAYEQDYINSGKKDDDLMQISYGTFYSEKNIHLKFEKNGSTTYSNIPQNYIVPQSGTLSVQKYDGKRILMISETMCDDEILITYSKDISYLDDELKQLVGVFALLSVLVSAILAVLLYFVQRRLFLPLKKLQAITKEIAGGNLSSRADDSGQDEFSALARDFNSMAEKINQQLNELTTSASQKQQMLDNLAHEMRTPLTSIYGYAEYAFGANINEEERMKAMNAIMSESMRLKNISAALLNLTSMRENGIDHKIINVKQLLSRTKERFSITAAAKKITLTYDGSDFSVIGDETLLEELVSNLTENAIKACGENGLVELGTFIQGNFKTLFVKDNGIGMTEEQLAHITEPFYRTDKSRSRTNGGTGLGLALCKRIADAHKATLEFSSTPGVGTIAYLKWEEIQ